MTPITTDTLINTCINEYNENPKSIEQKQHNIKIVDNITKRIAKSIYHYDKPEDTLDSIINKL